MSERAHNLPGSPLAWNVDASAGHPELGSGSLPRRSGSPAARSAGSRLGPVRFAAGGASSGGGGGSGSWFHQPTRGWYARAAIIGSTGGGIIIALIAAAKGIL